MDDLEKRIAALERENRDPKGRLDALAPAPKVRPLPPSPVRITSPSLAKIELPTEDEYRRLRENVLRKFPILKPRDAQGFEEEFRWAFQFLQHTGRREKLDRDHDLLFWIDTVVAWLRKHKIAPGVLMIGGTAFVAAAIASGDILYTLPDAFPHIYFGLVPYGGGLEAKGYWKRVLSGTILGASPPLYPKPEPAPSRIRRQGTGL
jgi:hypothetical protein